MNRRPSIDMTIALACLLAILTSCASSPRARAAQTVMISDALADEVAEQWSGYVDAKIESCKQENLSTPQEREECLGPAANGEALAAAADSLVLVQRAIKEGLKCEELDTCVQKVDWSALHRDAAGVLSKFQSLRRTIKESSP